MTQSLNIYPESTTKSQISINELEGTNQRVGTTLAKKKKNADQQEATNNKKG
jgi:hypothetical protein